MFSIEDIFNESFHKTISTESSLPVTWLILHEHVTNKITGHNLFIPSSQFHFNKNYKSDFFFLFYLFFHSKSWTKIFSQRNDDENLVNTELTGKKVLTDCILNTGYQFETKTMSQYALKLHKKVLQECLKPRAGSSSLLYNFKKMFTIIFFSFIQKIFYFLFFIFSPNLNHP